LKADDKCMNVSPYPEFRIDAALFQEPLRSLAEVIAQKLQREAFKGQVLQFVGFDMFVQVRLAMRTYDLLCFINADERRETDFRWDPTYTFVSAPLVRCVIDCLYNVTMILQDPALNGPKFRKSGIKKEMKALNRDAAKCSGQADWDAFITEKRSQLDAAIQKSPFTLDEIMSEKS